MSETLVVYTAVTGGFKNALRPPVNWEDPDERDIQLVCISDCLFKAPAPWALVPPLWEHADPRRTARWHKLLPHRIWPEATYWLWMDGNQQLACNPWMLVDKFMADTSVVSYKHPQRGDVYDEAEACIRLEKDDPGTIKVQITRYRQDKYPPKSGLTETTIMLRRNTPKVCEMNEAWWAEMKQGSCRDQLSFDYVMWKAELNRGVIPGQRDRPKFFNYFAHR